MQSNMISCQASPVADLNRTSMAMGKDWKLLLQISVVWNVILSIKIVRVGSFKVIQIRSLMKISRIIIGYKKLHPGFGPRHFPSLRWLCSRWSRTFCLRVLS